MKIKSIIRGVARYILHLPAFIRYVFSFRQYNQKAQEKAHLSDLAPRFSDSTKITVPNHNFYETMWAAEKIIKNGPQQHIDVGSDIKFLGVLSRSIPVTFVDIRPLDADFGNLISKKGSILSLPFASSSVESISTLSVVEHIGLGRYGDPIDPDGAYKSCRELARVLKEQGNLYISVPIGRKRICFNAHRIFSVKEILDYFNDLMLVEFNAIGDNGVFVRNANPDDYDSCEFGCGMFHFVKK